MPRKPRLNLPHAHYHVYARGNNRGSLFVDDADRLLYLRLLGKTVSRDEWRCLEYCLMSNHVHLLIQTPEANLSHGMQLVHGRYAQAFNFRHDRRGHLFEGRFGAVRIESDRQLIAVSRYIAQNPVEAGLCERAEDWPWSSFYAGSAQRPEWLDLPVESRDPEVGVEAVLRAG